MAAVQKVKEGSGRPRCGRQSLPIEAQEKGEHRSPADSGAHGDQSGGERGLLGHKAQEQRGGAAAHEDVELGYRLWKAGLKVIHLEEPLAHHYHPETLETACKRADQRGLNWEYFFALVPVPELPVRYHIFTRRTARYHFRAMFGGKEEHLFPDQDLGLGRLLRNMVLRPILFNRLTVPCFWKPLLNRAEQSEALARLLDVRMYQGVVAYYFFRGCRKGRKLPRPAEQE